MLTGVGIAGCGRMGEPMLAALRGHGFDARGFDVRPTSEFGPLEPHMTNDVATFAGGLEILITVVRDTAQTDDVLFNAQNFIQSAKSLKYIVISSTLSPKYVRALRARIPDHIKLIDAPMSGARIAATEQRLSFMLGGDAQDLLHLDPLFQAMGKHFHHMGDFGAGMSSKVLNNLLAASNAAMTRLVLEWAKDANLDETQLLNLIQASSGQNWFASGFDDIEFSREGYSADNTMGILIKDVQSALDAAPDGAQTALPRAVQDAIKLLKPKAD